MDVLIDPTMAMVGIYIAGMWSQEPMRKVLHAVADLVTGLKAGEPDASK